jgi:hypothetical protein
MHRTSIKFACALVILLMNSFCQKDDTTKVIVRIGGSAVNQKSYDAFGALRNLYPTEISRTFPGSRAQITALVETAVLYDHAKSALKDSLKASHDWSWKRTYFPAQLYVSRELEKKLGVPDKLIKDYYTTHRDSFKIVPPPVDSATADSLKKAEKKNFFARLFKPAAKTQYQPLEKVQSSIARKLFAGPPFSSSAPIRSSTAYPIRIPLRSWWAKAS